MKTYPLRVIQDAYAAFDQHVAGSIELARTSRGSTVPCKRGCSACCSEPLIVTQYCMPPIIEKIRAMPKAERAAIKKRIVEWVRLLHEKGIHRDSTDPDLDFAAWHRAPKPVCPLLDRATGDCSVYEARPIGCRSHVVVDEDPSACDRADSSKGISVLLFTEPATKTLAHCMAHSVGEARDVPLLMLLLPSMLARAWVLVENPGLHYFEWFQEIERRWRAGEQV